MNSALADLPALAAAGLKNGWIIPPAPKPILPRSINGKQASQGGCAPGHLRHTWLKTSDGAVQCPHCLKLRDLAALHKTGGSPL